MISVTISRYRDRAILEIDIEGIEYLADVLENEVSRTALAGVNGGRGDGGAVDIAQAIRDELARTAPDESEDE